MTSRLPIASFPCPNEPTCMLTRELRASHALAVFRAFYCESGGARCERLRRLVSGEHVPADLLPDGRRTGEFAFVREAA